MRYNKTWEIVKIVGVHYDDPPNILSKINEKKLKKIKNIIKCR